MDGSGGIPLTQPPPAKEADEAAAALALTKRARKRSRYLSPPYTDTDVQEGGVAGEEEEPPDVSAAAALSALLDAALWHGHGVDPAALRFLALHRSRNRTTATGTFDNHPGPRAAAAAGSSHDGGTKKHSSPGGGGGGGVGHTKLNLSAGPAMPGPVDGSPALAKKKKNPNADGPMQDAAATVQAQAAGEHTWASQSASFAANGTYGAANPAPTPERRKKTKYKKRAKSAGPEQQHFGNPVALVLDYAAGAPLPSREHLVSTFRRFGLVIDSETAVAQDKRSARVAFATRAEAEAAFSCAGALGAAFAPPSAVPSLQDLPPIARGAPPPPLPKLPLTDIRSNLEMMIASLKATAEAAANSPDNLVGEMQGLLAKVDKKLQGRSATAAHHH
ncbi:hypothetical protein SETIT_3G116400v2 [Setaria italica]|uniref:Uncharacterized protein n=2 Tax=Setaria italica TaxID=4555 RepID=A0A368QDZ7_SETIT|nr:uncharacterized protein LOC101772251 [Setaria italica]RCV16169.1 hypothetical protein SETIT_3G116400v2 [Setaria italica]